jgi:hypothetical protein
MNPWTQAISDAKREPVSANSEEEIREAVWKAEEYALKLGIRDAWGKFVEPALALWEVAGQWPDDYDRLLDRARLGSLSSSDLCAKLMALVDRHEKNRHLDDIERILLGT